MRKSPTRRAFLAALVLATGTGTAAAARQILRVQGQVTPKNYKGLETFLFNSLDSVVGLKIAFAANPDSSDGEIATSMDDDQFSAYLRESEPESEIVADKNVSLLHGDYVIDGFFVVKSGGLHQGITSLYLDKTDEGTILVSGAKIKDIDINRLRAG